MLPAEASGEARREQRGEHGAGVAGAGDAERHALMLRRIPARGQRQRDGEGGAGDAEHDARAAAPATKLWMPSGQAVTRPAMTMSWPMMPVRFGADAVDEHAEHHAQQRAGEHRHRDHQALLRRVEVEIVRDLPRRAGRAAPRP